MWVGSLIFRFIISLVGLGKIVETSTFGSSDVGFDV